MIDDCILIADDHPLICKGLQQEFEDHGYGNIHIAKDGLEALEFIRTKHPKYVFLDIEMPILSGFEVIEKAKVLKVTSKFIILTYHKEKGLLIRAKKLGVDAFLLKDDDFSEIKNCLAAIKNNEYYVSKSFDSETVVKADKQFMLLQLLTPSERTILRMIAKNLTSREIAKQLSVSKRTVEKHRTNIIAKLELQSNKEVLSIWAVKHASLIQPL